MHELAAKVDEYARGMVSGSGSALFEELGLYYIGPVDGHNIDDLVAILKEVKSTKTTGPVLIHTVIEKGRGCPYAEKAADHQLQSRVPFAPQVHVHGHLWAIVPFPISPSLILKNILLNPFLQTIF
ncbi:hypothetical protein VitviT2T_021584 [Vitis vinifera]|uniref:1-deoxy-D-xylulose-5-phosphate synthase, chloroplastic n=1 Tax=Vitis vinifera TaxID=29760 RepID=A0ABY9D7Z2_VITVI|nr:hypothetical protein VitviT2T_021584 [Vitis vinifera]